MQSSSAGKGKGRVNKRRRRKKRTMNGVEPQIMIVMVVQQLLPPVGLSFGFLHRTVLLIPGVTVFVSIRQASIHTQTH